MSDTDTTTAIELRRLKLDEDRLALDRMRIENERRGPRTAEEAAFDVAIRQATTLADSPVLFYDESRVKKIADDEGAMHEDPAVRARAWSIARTSYRNERIAFAVQLLAFAQAMGVPLALLAGQAHIVKGRTGFATSFLIGLVNARAGLRESIDWTVEGQGSSLKVTCHAVDADGKRRAVTITMEQAQRWGWVKTDPWKADPALMLSYRSAAQLIRLYFSAAVFGLPLVTTEELRSGSFIEGESEPAPPPAAGIPASRQLPAIDDEPPAPPLPEAEPERVGPTQARSLFPDAK